MRRPAPLRAAVASLALALADARGAPPILTPRDAPPARIAALGPVAYLEAFSFSGDGAVAAATFPSPRRADRSVLRFSLAGEDPREAELPGHAVGLAISHDGSTAYAVVRWNDRKGAVRAAELWRIDLRTARTSAGTSLPPTARGLALSDRGERVLVACRDEVRSFVLPGLESGPLYRVQGDNLGVAAFRGTPVILVVRADVVALLDLSGAQGRDGLVPFDATAAPGPLRGAGSSGTEQEPLVVGEDGRFWSVRVEPPILATTVVPAPAEGPPPLDVPPPAEPTPVETAPAEIPPVETPAVESASFESPPADMAPTEPPSAATRGPGFVRGTIRGEGRASVAAVVAFGPDSIVKEALRVVPDAAGRWEAGPLPAGSYRILPAGERGRVLRCTPPFVTIVIGQEGAPLEADFDVAGAY